MKLYKDLFSGDEMFSDIFRIETVNPAVYKIKGKLVTETSDFDDAAIGANASAEESIESAESSSKTGVNIVLSNRLVECAQEKKAWTAHIKEYMKRLKAKLVERKDPELESFEKNCQDFVKTVLKEFKEYQFFAGESMNPEGMMALMRWDGETPTMYFF